MQQTLLTLVAVVNGGVILAIEILGARFLAPYFGATIHLWTAQIVVTLAALSIGYTLGGRWSENSTTRLRNLVIACLFAGIWLCLVPAMGSGCEVLARRLGFRYGVLVSALLIFSPPLISLGTILPVVTKMATEGVSDAGRKIGNLYALSTVGSIAGALGITYLAIPFLSIPWIFRSLAGLVGLCALLLFGAGGLKILLGLSSLCALLAVLLQPHTPAYGGTVLQAMQTPYNDLRVVQDSQGRLMYLNRWLQGRVSKNGHPRSEYFRGLAAGVELRPGAQRVLVIGLGVGGTPRLYAKRLPQATVEAVEIDPQVVAAARQWFSFPENLTVHVDDGRSFFLQSRPPDDVIVVDAYANGEVPAHLCTMEFFRLLKASLTRDGVLITQLHGQETGPTSLFWRALWKTLTPSFAHLGRETLQTSRVERMILFASDGPVRGNSTPPPLDDVPLLTDAYCPIEVLCEPLLAETLVRWQSSRN